MTPQTHLQNLDSGLDVLSLGELRASHSDALPRYHLQTRLQFDRQTNPSRVCVLCVETKCLKTNSFKNKKYLHVRRQLDEVSPSEPTGEVLAFLALHRRLQPIKMLRTDACAVHHINHRCRDAPKRTLTSMNGLARSWNRWTSSSRKPYATCEGKRKIRTLQVRKLPQQNLESCGRPWTAIGIPPPCSRFRKKNYTSHFTVSVTLQSRVFGSLGTATLWH